ncbi:MAG: hypothetical protein VX663_07810 [Pseudomonadota bacterium]|nr:hypothetical protein [Pseudomonadota bacterium]
MSTYVQIDSDRPSQAETLLRDLRGAVESGRLDRFDALASELATAVRTLAAQSGAGSSQRLAALQKELLQLVAESKARREEISQQLREARKNRRGVAVYRQVH